MKTAIEWLYNELSKNNTSIDSVIERINKDSSIWKQAKQMEKEQIIEANRQGRCNDCPIMYSNQEAQEYYNQTYNQNK